MPLHECGLFTPWTDPQSGVTSYILTGRVAPLQQSFYFTNTSFSADGRFLWFYCAHPPSGTAQAGRTLGVADLEEGTARELPETQFFDASPAVDPKTGEVYWCTARSVWRRGPAPDAAVQHVNDLPADIARNRLTHRLATHLTFSADRSELNIDAQIGNDWYVGSMPVDGRPSQLWEQFRRCYNHGQFSPTDPDLMLIAQDHWTDAVTGERHTYDNRMWLIHRGGKAEPIFDPSPMVGHEWWDPAGTHVWYVEYARGTARVDIATCEAEMIWPGGRWHSHASASGRYLVGDHYRRDADRRPLGARVSFYDTDSGREVDIVSQLPPPDSFGPYHVHPHPQFCLGDRYICYTTTAYGRADLALVPVEALVTLT